MTSVLNVDSIAAKDGTSPVELTKQSAAKAWANYQASGTAHIDDSFGISSLTDVSTGQIKITVVNAFATAEYASSGSHNSTAFNYAMSNFTTTEAISYHRNDGLTYTDPDHISMIHNGDLA